MMDFEKNLQEIVKRNNVLKNEPMAKHTSLKIGGIADYFIKVKTVDELKKILEFATENKIQTTIVGNGTNLLVKDGGIRGVVIKLELIDFKIKKMANEVLITVGSGMTLAALAAMALKEEIAGLEFLSGIPGTIGGAIRMNAGAYGSEMKDIVVKTRYMTYDDDTRRHFKCNVCGSLWSATFEWMGSNLLTSVACGVNTTLKCGMTTSTITNYNLGCGKTTSTIESATIIY